jgi:uncharacterized protein YkwD
MSAVARFRYTLVAGSTSVVIGVGFTVVGLNKHADAVEAVPRAATAGYAASAAPPAGPLGDLPLPDPTTAPAPASPSPRATTPAAAKPKVSTKTPVRTKPRTTTQAPAPAADDAPATGDAILDQVLAHINAARAQSGLAAYALDSDLSKASALHNQLMIDGCGLSHQCPGEQGIGARFSAQGVTWTSAGENIGYGSSGASDAAIISAANGLTDSMLAEVAPNDGHKKNLLNSGFKRIGLSVVRDSKGLVWMTQDFVN